ncbi:MAG: hypothetical protein V3V62_02190 [bacterium]
MNDIPWESAPLAAAGLLISGFPKGASGFGSAAAPLLPKVIPPEAAVAPPVRVP